MASVYYERLLSEDQIQRGYEFREEIFRNSEAFKSGVISEISDDFDQVAHHFGFFTEGKLIGYVRFIPWTEKLKLPFDSKYNFEKIDCDYNRLYEISRLSISKSLQLSEVLGLFRLFNEIKFKVLNAQTFVISLVKNCVFYEKTFGFNKVQEKNKIFLLVK